MLYMPDALNAITQLMEADPTKLVHRNSFNITCMSFTPTQLFEKIKQRIPDAVFDYDVDPVKAQISASWPNKLDDTWETDTAGINTKSGKIVIRQQLS